MGTRGNLTTCALAALAALFAHTVAAQGTIVTCESQNYQNAECPIAGGPVAIIRQLSTPPGNCIEGQTWGFNGYNNTIWVTGGCRAEFRTGYGRPHPQAGATVVVCESQNYRNAECPVAGGPVALVRQLSTPPGNCIEGQTWGFNSYNNTIWVTGGCRAEFRTGYGGGYAAPASDAGDDSDLRIAELSQRGVRGSRWARGALPAAQHPARRLHRRPDLGFQRLQQHDLGDQRMPGRVSRRVRRLRA